MATNRSGSPVVHRFYNQYPGEKIWYSRLGNTPLNARLNMRVLRESVIWEFCESHADLRKPAARWISLVRLADWRDPHDLKMTFPTVILLGDETVVFNLKGNRYRLMAKPDYVNGLIRIQKVGTHAEYSKWKM